MKKLLKPKDIFILSLANLGDAVDEVKDPLHLISKSYESIYGYIPKKYKRSNFEQMVNRALKTKDIELVIKGGEKYLRLTSFGEKRIQRDFSISSLSKKWNRKWIILFFDIEEKFHKVRDRLRNKLKNIGLGMLQKSIWITPLPIGSDLLELIDSLGLSESVFVMEVSHLILGDPLYLVKKVWHLDKLESEYQILKEEGIVTKQLLEKLRGRDEKRKKDLRRLSKLEQKQKVLKKKYLEFVLTLPPLPKELLPEALQDLRPFKFK